jgi:hypothetical protein
MLELDVRVTVCVYMCVFLQNCSSSDNLIHNAWYACILVGVEVYKRKSCLAIYISIYIYINYY